MKWTVFVALALIGLVAGEGNGAWKNDQEYKYKLVVKTFVSSPQAHKQKGLLSSLYLTIRPRTSNVLIAQITRAGYTELKDKDNKENFSNESRDSNEREQRMRANHQQILRKGVSYEPEPQERASIDEPLKKPFEIHLRNGAIQSISVDDSLTTEQVNQLKYIVSQFQVDTKAERGVDREGNHPPNVNTNNAFFVTMEPTVTGSCETTYDISRIPEYLALARDSIPHPQLVGDKHIIQIVKNKNYNKCNEETSQVTSLTGHKEEISRIVITGTLNDYTIQSSATTKKADGFREYAYLTLESIERMNANDNDNSTGRLHNLKFIYGLVPRENNKNQRHRMEDDERANRQIARSSQSNSRYNHPDPPEEAWSTCYTQPIDRRSICKREFSAEWTPVGGSCCGFLCMGQNVLCRLSFPGCEASACYSAFTQQEDMCKGSFEGRLPVPRGGFTDCAPGFYSARCCPN